MTLEAFLAHFDDVRLVGDQFVARCPGHSDQRPSLAIRQAGDRILLFDRAQHCRSEDILRTRGLTLADLFVTTRRSTEGRTKLPMSPLASARQAILREARRQAWARPGVLLRYAIADWLRAADDLRRLVTTRGDSTVTWTALAIVAEVQRIAESLLAELDDQARERAA